MAANPPRRLTKGQLTRQRLVTAAAELIATRGYHAVGMTDIGAEAGVTASAIYRHFSGKSAILAAVSRAVVDEFLTTGRRIQASDLPPEEALDELLRTHIEFAISKSALIRVYNQEGRSLPEADRRDVRGRQRRYAGIWADVLLQLRPELSEQEAKLYVEGVIRMLDAAIQPPADLGAAQVARQLTSMARAALDQI